MKNRRRGTSRQDIDAALAVLGREGTEITPQAVLAWAVETYRDSLCFATMLDAEGCALVALLAEVAPRVPIYLPDTGYISAGVFAVRESLQQQYGIAIRLVRPSVSSISFESDYGPLQQRNPARCCRVNRWQPLQNILSRYAARIAARRRALCPLMRDVPFIAWEDSLHMVQVNPLADWSDARLQTFLQEHRVPHLSSDNTERSRCMSCPRRWEDVLPDLAHDEQEKSTQKRRWSPFSRLLNARAAVVGKTR